MNQHLLTKQLTSAHFGFTSTTMTANNQDKNIDKLHPELEQREHIDKLFNKIKVATIVEQLLLFLTGSAICYYILS